MAEASIGSGLSTLIFLYAIRRTAGRGGMSMAEMIGSILILLGAFFLFSAGLGMLRMPDAYTRMQAGTKASTLGNTLVLAGLAFYHPGWTPEARNPHLLRADDQSDVFARAGARRPPDPDPNGARDDRRRAARCPKASARRRMISAHQHHRRRRPVRARVREPCR